MSGAYVRGTVISWLVQVLGPRSRRARPAGLALVDQRLTWLRFWRYPMGVACLSQGLSLPQEMADVSEEGR
jgi:hypothetical protein